MKERKIIDVYIEAEGTPNIVRLLTLSDGSLVKCITDRYSGHTKWIELSTRMPNILDLPREDEDESK